MRTLPLVVLALVATLAAQLTSAQEGVLTGDPPRGAALLAEARGALGGERLSSVKALQLRGKFRRTAGNAQLEGDLELTLQMPDRMKRIEDTSAPGGGPAIVATQVLNGSEVWDENTGRGGGQGGFGRGGFGRGGFGPRAGGAPPDGQAPAPGVRGNIDPERLRQALVAQRQAEMQRLLVGLLLSTDAQVSWVATAESPEGRADVLELRQPGGPAMRLFLDEATHVPLMLTWTGAGPQAGRGGRGRPGGQGDDAGAPAPPAPGDADGPGPRRGGPPAAVTFQMTFADYKAVGGIRFPHTITRGVNGQTNEEWAVSSYRVDPALRADTFRQK